MKSPTKILADSPEREAISDNELIEWAKSDHRYFEPIYEKYHEQIYRLVFTRVQDLEIAQDITSNIFCKALVNLSKYEDKGLSFSSWLYRIALNACYDFFREQKKKRTVVLEDFMTEDLVDEFDSEAEYMIKGLKRLPEALNKLKPLELELIELRFFEEKSFKEIGEILSITENNAKTRSYRILERIKKTLIQKRNEL